MNTKLVPNEKKLNYQDCMESAKNHMNYALSKYNHTEDKKEQAYWTAEYNKYRDEYLKYKGLYESEG